MISIFHGDDSAASRKAFIKQVQQTKAYIYNGKTLEKTQLVQIFEGGSLFDDTPTIFIEELLTGKKASKEQEALVFYLNSVTTGDIVLWENKELTKKQLGLFPKAKTLSFKLPQSLFQFLDAIKPCNGKQLLTLFQKTLEQSEAELVFFMIVRQFRLLLALYEPSLDTIDEAKRLAPWQKSKLQKQARSFQLEELKRHYQKLSAMDVAQKTGGLSLPLKKAIDIFLVEL